MMPYPQGSYYPAALLLPLFNDSPLLALRSAAWIAVLWMFAAQYTLLCRIFRPVQSHALLLLWQLICLYAKMANINHVFEVQFNYSRVVGGASLWLTLVFLTTPDTIRWRRLLWQSLAILTACYALLCHLAPGALAFAAIGFFGCLEWRRGQRDAILLLLGTFVAGLALSLSVNCFGMLNYKAHPGDMPIGPLWLLLGWIPTWVITGFRQWRNASSETLAIIERVLTAVLLPGGVLQAYAAWQLWRDASCAPYSVNVLFFYTFPFASLLCLIWLTRYLLQREMVWPDRLRPVRVYGLQAWNVIALCWLSYDYCAHERGLRDRITLRGSDRTAVARVKLGKEGRPLRVTSQLAALGKEYEGGFYYLDPQQRHGAYYATMQGLHVPLPKAQRWWLLSLKPETRDELLRDPEIKGVLLPHNVDPHTVFHTPFDVQEVGSFWCCRAR